MGCACLFAMLAGFAPRIAFGLLWLFNPGYVNRAFSSFFWPLLGIFFLPFTSLMWVFTYVPGLGHTFWGWIWIAIGVLFDLGSYGWGGNSARHSSAK